MIHFKKGTYMRPAEDESGYATNTPPPSAVHDGAFRKSSFSNSGGCVEVARFADGRVQVRDTKDVTHTTLSFTAHEWIMFLKGVRNGEFEVET